MSEWRVALGYLLFFAAAVGLSGVVGSAIGHWIFAGMGADNEHQVNRDMWAVRNTAPKSRRPRGCYKRVAFVLVIGALWLTLWCVVFGIY